MYFNAKGKLCSILASWTSLAESDLFAQTAAGRGVVSGRRPGAAVAHIAELKGRHKTRRVKQIMPLIVKINPPLSSISCQFHPGLMKQ